MRLIGSLDNEKQAFHFYAYLHKMGIRSTYEPFYDEQTKKESVRIWVYDEEDMDLAIEALEEYKKHPSDSKFADVEPPLILPQPVGEITSAQTKALKKIRISSRQKFKPHFYALTYLIILICGILFFYSSMQTYALFEQVGAMAEEVLTPIQSKLFFDFPESQQLLDDFIIENHIKNIEELDQLTGAKKQAYEQIEAIPRWKGLLDSWFKQDKVQEKAPLFEKIRQGEVWRLITPVFLHANFLHILFNMIWVWLLCKQIEERLKRWKMVILMVIIGVISNIAQYFMTGPFFLGYSGIIVGLVGFIWMRQRIAAWEGYPLQKMVVVFIVAFVLAMFGLELFSLFLKIFHHPVNLEIANTAHIVGGFVGLLLGRLSFFSREES